ncbi:hypothetical protein [Mesorhizobium sp. 10J20-29]
MDNKNVIIGAIAAIILIAIIGWYAGWFGAGETTPPAVATEEPATTEEPPATEEPATTEQPAAN